MTVLWYDLYPSKIQVDSNGKSATRLIRVFSDPSNPTPFDQDSVFADVVTGPAAPTSPTGGIPQRGDFFPGDTSMVLGTRTIERINSGEGDIHLRLDYSRVNWGSIDTFFPGDDGASLPPYIDLRTTGQKLVTPVPRVIAFPIKNGPIYSYSVVSEPRTRFQTNITATFHLDDWTAADVQVAEELTGGITSDLSVLVPETGFAADALFTNYNVTRLGENLYRVVYQWVRMPNLPALDEETIDVPGQADAIRRLAVPAVDAHSNLQVIQRPFIQPVPNGTAIAAEPVLVQTEPISERFVHLSTELPGLQHASIVI